MVDCSLVALDPTTARTIVSDAIHGDYHVTYDELHEAATTIVDALDEVEKEVDLLWEIAAASAQLTDALDLSKNDPVSFRAIEGAMARLGAAQSHYERMYERGCL